MRLERNKWLLTALLLASSALWGCGSESETEDASQRGQVSLALQSTSQSGVPYGLFAEIRVQGPEDFVGFTDPFQARFMKDVQAGSYDVELLEGYALLNLETGRIEELATLVSANPVAVEVPANGVGSLVFTFAVPGGQVSFETGTLDVGLEVIEGLPDGSGCEADTDCASGSCVGGVCGGGAGGTGGGANEHLLTADISCELPAGLGTADADVEVTVSPRSVWTPNGAVTVDFEAIATLSAELGDVLIALGTDQINIDSLLARMTVAGGTPTEISLTDGPLTLDVDSNDDGVAEDLRIAISVPPVVVTNDGADSVDFSVAHFEVELSDVPLLGSVVVTSDPTGSGQFIVCSISSTLVSFEVDGDVGGTGGTGGVGGAGGTGGVGGGEPFGCAELEAEQSALYATSCLLDVAGGVNLDLTTTIYATSAGDVLFVDEGSAVTTCGEITLSPDIVDLVSNLDAEISQGDVQLAVANAWPQAISHQVPLGPLFSPMETDAITTELVADGVGDVVITPESVTIVVTAELTPGIPQSVQVQIPSPECPDGFQLVEGENPLVFETAIPF